MAGLCNLLITSNDLDIWEVQVNKYIANTDTFYTNL